MSSTKVFQITYDKSLLYDLDGTTMPLLHDPNARRVEPMMIQAVSDFIKITTGHVITMTARDSNQVQVCYGMNRIPHPVIASNGAELMLPNGDIKLYPFSDAYKDFLSYAAETVTDFAKKHPWLPVESKVAAFGFHSTLVQGFDCERVGSVDKALDMVRSSSEQANVMILKLQRRASESKLDFQLCADEQTHRGITFNGVNKLQALDTFADFLPHFPKTNDWSSVMYFGDSLLAATDQKLAGNDRPIAKQVRTNGGVVVQVVNRTNNDTSHGGEDRIPPENDAAEPHFAFETPSELSFVLRSKIRALMTRKTCQPL